MRTHYPRTPHLPWSPGASSDDVRAGDLAGLLGREVVVTEKLDGENTTLYADGLHARSLDSGHHPSRAWVKGLQGRIGAGIPHGRRICGENLYARHSLAYEELDSWFYGFSVWDGEHCLDWDRTVRFLTRLGVPTPPVLWRGVFDERALRGLRLDTTRQEGYVVRTVAGFERAAFGRHVAKWVRGGHVTTDTHWMYAAVVENGLGPAAPLWAVRSGAAPDVSGLLAAAGYAGTARWWPEAALDAAGAVDAAAGVAVDPDAAAAAGAEAAARLDLLGRTGEARLAGVLAAALHTARRAELLPRLAPALGMPLARRVADLVGLQGQLHRPFPDAERRGGLVRMAAAADPGVLHAVAGAVAAVREDPAAAEQVAWSALHAEEAGLLTGGAAGAPLEPLRAALRASFTGRHAGGSGRADRAAQADQADDHRDPADVGDAADRCWAEALAAYARGRITTPEEAVAATWRWRDGAFPRLVQLVGPSGSGKSTFAQGLAARERVSLDDLRAARGARSDQSANEAVLRAGLHRLDTALASAAADGGTVVWDATSLNDRQRALVGEVARRRNALVTHAVVVVAEEELRRRNSTRAHPVPADVLTTQLRRFSPPYPGQAHRTWYVGADGAVEDTAGALKDEDA
ncbi:RNA ligase family protein [Streptomyces sp. NPDC090022]|uniref:RNA ligase family protein n=1 Tax=Streptomyces sp. NPDC090022 TaxID=3365920 RepID=UPI00381B2921